MQDQILGSDATAQFAVKAHAHLLRLLLAQRLGYEGMRAFRLPDAKGERAQSAISAGVAVAANDRQARQNKAEFGPMTCTMPWPS